MRDDIARDAAGFPITQEQYDVMLRTIERFTHIAAPTTPPSQEIAKAIERLRQIDAILVSPEERGTFFAELANLLERLAANTRLMQLHRRLRGHTPAGDLNVPSQGE